ncbi:UDP-glucosyltransferase 2-like isoform X2 [Uranotaenia lowii]|uniref:UDP-glucosyltransferase 2-like isoform X2 n=1 Tax=Uranotaenia lowii TaxID=190385 RepID=UPI00247B2722|nr:UDP-glucosyltransferase 2-like isoform X2 [Uranotaenia lowii]
MKVLLTLLALCFSAEAANILYVNQVASPSHFVWHRSLIHGLASKGHNVTVLSVDVDEAPPPNVSFIHVDGVYESFFEDEEESLDFFALGQMDAFVALRIFNDILLQGCGAALQSKGLQTLMAYPSEFKFDLIINDFLSGPCLSAIAQHKFGRPPYIPVTAFNGITATVSQAGSYSYPAIIPNHEYDTPEKMNYAQRFMNFLYSHWEELLNQYNMVPEMDKLVRQLIPDIPYLDDFDKDTRLVLLNSHPAIQYSEPTMPSVISVGGLQIQQPKELPDDLKQVVEKAKNGVILFSLGTNVRSDSLGDERIIAIVNAMAKFPQYQFLWKFETDVLPVEVPKNVYIRSWMPQNDILAHPNVKLFITHSGLLSTQEAVWYGVPMIGFPVFADQYRNTNYITERGAGRRLSLKNIKSDDLADAIRDVMTDQSYRKNMAEISKVFRDQPEHPLDRAIWWTEWVLRNPDSRILQSNALYISWMTKYSFDVIVPLVVIGLLALKVVVLGLKFILCKKQTARKTKNE